MPLDWYPFFVIDYRKDTYHLSLAEDGAYRRLIDEYMTTREPLPNSDTALARILGITTAEWDCVKACVRAFFKPKNDRLTHKRCDQELRAQELRNKANSNRGKKAAFTRWSKIKGLNARPMLAPATLQYKDKITSSEPVAAREESSEEKEESQSVIAFKQRIAQRNSGKL